MQKLSGKTALITGGNSGIGLATAKMFLAQGARVAISGRNAQALEEAAQNLGGGVLTLQCDAGKVADIEAAMAMLKEHWGQLDVLVVNAAIPGPITTPMWDKFGMPDEAMQAVKEEVQRKSPIKRFGEAEEVARVAVFLASAESSYIVGQEIVVDGGMSLL
jgi:NAD(P)-dependent dehydrogenase (short-subunit alcohol dehydrogenase family)